MPKGYLYVGCRWGELRCVEQEMALKSSGNATDGYHQRTALQYSLVCNCKREFKIWASQFPGKRLMRDCGCGKATAHTVTLRVRTPLDVIEILQQYAAEEENPMSSEFAVLDLVRKGWSAHLAESKEVKEIEEAEE